MSSGLIILLGNAMSPINFKANCYPFRQDSTFLYYFGISSPRMIGIIDCDENRDYLFRDDVDMDSVVWTGPQIATVELAHKVGVEHSGTYAQAFVFVSKFLRESKAGIHYLPPYRPDHELLLSQLLSTSPHQVAASTSVRLIQAVVAQRSIKSAEEIDQMDQAARLSADMHQHVIRSARVGMYEYELVAMAQKYMQEREGRFSYAPILTTQGQILHNEHYGNQLKNGDMVLFDGGTETEMGYAADLTRTFPVNNTFTTQQKVLYDIVFDAFSAARDALRPGTKFIDIHLLAARRLVKGLCEIGLMKGDVEEAVAEGAHTLFFQCGLGHHIGLDVHDMENLGEQYVGYTADLIQSKDFGLKSLRLGKSLEEGYTITVEPGIYMIPALMDMYVAERKFESFINYSELTHYRQFGGIRIEDNFAITASGARLIGKKLAASIEEIENLRL